MKIDDDIQVLLNITEYGPEEGVDYYSVQVLFQDRTDGTILNAGADGIPNVHSLYQVKH